MQSLSNWKQWIVKPTREIWVIWPFRWCQVQTLFSPFIYGSLKRKHIHPQQKTTCPGHMWLGDALPRGQMETPSFQHVLEHWGVHLHGLEAPLQALEGGLLPIALPPADEGLHHLRVHVVGVVGLAAVDVILGQSQGQHHGLPLGAQPLGQLVNLPVWWGAVEDVWGDSSSPVIWGGERHQGEKNKQTHQKEAKMKNAGRMTYTSKCQGQLFLVRSRLLSTKP